MNGGAPVQLYKATYSSVPVYEFPCQGVAVMRRKSDGWLNATQILKVAGFDKPQRTRVLEREVQKGTHEKVQGGYGKYQGTWVPMDRGIALSRQYGVDRLLQPIFDFVPTADSPPLAPKHITAPATRPKKKNDIADGEGGGQQQQQQQMKQQRAAQNKAAAAAKRAAAAESRRLAEEALEEEMMSEFGEEEELSMAGTGGGGSRRGGRGQGGRSATPSEQSEASETPSPLGSEADGEYQQAGPSASKKRKLQQVDPTTMGGGRGGHPVHHGHPGQVPQPLHQGAGGGPPIGNNLGAASQLGLGPLRYARMILDYFVSESTQVPQFLVTPPADFDANVVIDDDGHTALHWACAMGRIRIVKLLLSAGADIFRANSMGQTALMRSVMFTNNYDLRRFPELFELLHRSTINIDRNDRTVFHYIVDIALQKGKTHAARYYIETVLARLVDYPKEVADILNFQDEEGETALTLAARARSKRLVKILLDNGADPKVANRDGKTAEDYILEDELFRSSAAGEIPPPPPVIPYPAVDPLPPPPNPAMQTLPPALVSLLDSLMPAFETDVRAADNQLSLANSLLASIEDEAQELALEQQRLQGLIRASETLAAREAELRSELENKMGKRFRLGWEKWVRDEDAREQQYEEEIKRANEGTGPPAVPQADLDEYKAAAAQGPSLEQQSQLRDRIAEYKRRRKATFKVFCEKTGEMGTGGRMNQYRQLIALGCGVPLDQVDGTIDQLLATMEEGEE